MVKGRAGVDVGDCWDSKIDVSEDGERFSRLKEPW